MLKEKKNQESKTTNHANFQVSQKAILYNPQTKKFLILKTSDPAHGAVDSYWYDNYGPWDFAGGRVSENEGLIAGLQREVVEEIGEHDYEMTGPVVAERVHYSYGDVLLLGYLAFCHNEKIILDKEHIEICWVTAGEVEKNEEYKLWLKQFVKAAAERIKEREYLNDLKRLQADFDNYRKRQAENQKELAGFLIEKLVLDLVPVLDNFQAAIAHVPEESKNDPG